MPFLGFFGFLVFFSGVSGGVCPLDDDFPDEPPVDDPLPGGVSGLFGFGRTGRLPEPPFFPARDKRVKVSPDLID